MRYNYLAPKSVAEQGLGPFITNLVSMLSFTKSPDCTSLNTVRLAASLLLTLLIAAHAAGQSQPPVLISEPNSTRAIALESVTLTREPFPLNSLIAWSPDSRTRVIVFALNLEMEPGEDPANVIADAEDASKRHYALKVENVAPVPGQEWMTALTLRLDDQLTTVGDVLVRITYKNKSSNRVRIGIGKVGGGLADDPGSAPTPAPPYVIRGRISTRGLALAGATLTLSGAGSATATADTEGNYTILAPAPGNYSLCVAMQDYNFTPACLTIGNLSNTGVIADFTGLPHVFLQGRVSDSAGRGVFGVTITLSGPQSGTTSTNVDGNYSFLLTAFGNYSVTPWKAQNYYSFHPENVNVTGYEDSRVANFSALLSTSASPSYVLEFDGSPKTVDYSIPLPGDYNLFWPDGLDFGHFFWEFWAMPGSTTAPSYLISDGYGGAHAVLFGFGHLSGTEPGRYRLGGNVWNGVKLTSFYSDEGPAPFEWGHFAVGWDGQNIITYFNGVPVGKTAFVGPRITPGGFGGCGRLLIGGSDHLNLVGRIAQVRGYETYNPHSEGDNSVLASFAPETVFSVDGSLLSYFFNPGQNIADLSLRGQYGRQHPGLVRSTQNGVLRPCPGCPLPQFVLDNTAPDFENPNNPGQPPAPVETPAAVPAGALVFDSFSRRNSTYALGGRGGLGATEAGSAGSTAWVTHAGPADLSPFGILNGRAVVLDDATAVAWVQGFESSPPLFDLDIRVDRRVNRVAGRNTGISFRVADPQNYFFAYSSEGADSSKPQTLTVGYYADGIRKDLTTDVDIPGNWTTLRVITNRIGTIRVYADATLLYQSSHAFLASSGGAGLYNNGPGLGLTNRWDKFRVFPAPVP